ncbi:Transcription initiation factor TFIID subunit 7 [Nosema granulosis]|uniref:Transcription initiation factor TFIID subunit 7 n=1 Tax=Nosema granulosis TaxID=83296 RepID=A0A9P6GZW6_9MICR|nr:Transcription initiation factor TFIID subunit 7 [Nosema granulosis]
MEHHFILRFSKGFRENVNLHESKIERLDNDRVKLFYKNKSFPGIVVPLPCVVESQKTLDNKQFYKVCDVSTLIVIYPDDQIDLDKERQLLSLSGLTPPMKFVKSRRFAKKNVAIQEVEEIEKKVQELLERDRQSSKVEIVEEEEEDVDEISNIAAEIESNIEIKPAVEEKIEESPEILELRKQIVSQERRVEEALNPILKQRFQKALDEMKSRLQELTGPKK